MKIRSIQIWTANDLEKDAFGHKYRRQAERIMSISAASQQRDLPFAIEALAVATRYAPDSFLSRPTRSRPLPFRWHHVTLSGVEMQLKSRRRNLGASRNRPESILANMAADTFKLF